jgi:hypothetical protein
VDRCLTKPPCGGKKAGRSPVDRGKPGIKRSMAVNASVIPLGATTVLANRHDSPLLVPTLETVAKTLGGLQSRRASTSTETTTRTSPASGWRSWAWGGQLVAGLHWS